MRRLWWLMAATMVVGTGCADDVEEGGEATCPAGERLNPLTGVCVPERTTGGVPPLPDAGGEPAEMPDASGETGADAGESGEDAGGEEDGGGVPGCRDGDGDGAADPTCGGDDCDDADPARTPGRAEICDEVDNDCNGAVNDGVDCVFYAHSTRALYEIDPFAKTATEVGSADVSAIDALFDIDTAPDGTLYGLAGNTLYRYDATTGAWSSFDAPLGTDVGNANGMAIDNAGLVYITSSDELFTADLATGRGTRVGQTGGYASSGDAVVTKGNVLYMTATPAGLFGTSDRLVKVDGASAQVTPVGEIGFGGVWGLTAAWNRLYGLTDDGEVIVIDPETGRGALVHRFSGISFYGAASTPAR